MNAAEFQLGHGWLVAFLFLLTRVSAFILTFPIFARKYVPHLIKTGICMGLTIAWLPEFTAQSANGISQMTGFAMLTGAARELLIGGILGTILGLMMLPMRMAGIYIGQEMGFNLGGITDPGADSTSNEAGALLESLGILIFFGTNTHHTVLMALYASIYHKNIANDLRAFAETFFAHGLNQTHEVSLLLIAPIALCLFTTTVVLGVAMKSVPHVNLFSVGIPVRFAVGLIAFLAFLPTVLTNLANFFESQPDVWRWLF